MDSGEGGYREESAGAEKERVKNFSMSIYLSMNECTMSI